MVDKYLEIYQEIGSNLKRERKRAKLTQGQLAAKTTKLDASKISDIENAKEDFMFSTLLEISNGLGIGIEKLTKRSSIKKA